MESALVSSGEFPAEVARLVASASGTSSGVRTAGLMSVGQRVVAGYFARPV